LQLTSTPFQTERAAGANGRARDETQRIAAGIARLPELLGRKSNTLVSKDAAGTDRADWF
jgi:hypothetical protein